MSNERKYGLDRQALRLPLRSLDRLKMISNELRSSGFIDSTTSSVARGLCLIALSILQGTAGQKVADAFRTAATDSTARGIYAGLKTLRALLGLDDDEPATVRKPPIFRRVRRKQKPIRSNEDLRSQPLYLPKYALLQIDALTEELYDAGENATVSGVTRGLCVLALHFADDDMGYDIASIVRDAVAESTEEAAHRAAALLRPLFEEPPTLREPPLFDAFDIELDGPPTEEMPPSSSSRSNGRAERCLYDFGRAHESAANDR